MRRLSIIAMCVVSLFFLLSAQELPKAEFPVLTTSAGQSNDVVVLNILCEEAGILYDYCDVPTVDLITAGVGLGGAQPGPGFHVEIHTNTDLYPIGTPYKTVLVAIGASLKGMGASGLTVETEIARLKAVLSYCKEQKMFIVGVHLGGQAARGAPGSENELMIDTVAPYVDLLIVTGDGNVDGRFTKIAEARQIPIVVVDYAVDVIPILKALFGPQ
ncbi:MAG: DUF6305 family protein [Candidatus Methanomethyliaceae archaeon]